MTMNKHDTFYKLKDDISPGMMIEHKYRHDMLSPEFNWFCTINEIDAENNELKVTVTSGKGFSHQESWDMQITVNGLKTGEYIKSKGNEI